MASTSRFAVPLALVLALSACPGGDPIAGTPASESAEFKIGKLTLPPGWVYEHGTGEDQGVGTIWDHHSALVIRFDNGQMAGDYASQQHADQLDWLKVETVNGLRMTYGQKGDRLSVTFESSNGVPFNFYAKVRDAHDVDTMLGIMRTLHPL